LLKALNVLIFSPCSYKPIAMAVRISLHVLGSKLFTIYPITHLQLEKHANGMNFL